MALVKVWDSLLGWTNINISHKHYKADILDFSHSLLEHTVSGLTTGHVLQATSSTTYGFASLPSHMHTKAQISDFAHTHDDRYFLRTSKLKLGNYFQNVISSELSGNASEIIIKTRIKFEPFSKMPMIHLEGYLYGKSTTIDMKIAFYVYAPPETGAAAFYAPTYVCLSRWQPEVKLFTYTEENLIGTYIGIAIVGNMYFPRFTVNYLDIWGVSNSRDETDNWSVIYNQTDVSMLNATDIRDYDNETALGYSYLATNISGNLWGNADSASKVNNKLTVGSKQFDGSAPVTITLSDFEIPTWALKPSLDIDDIPTIPHTKLSGVINYQNLEAILSDYRTAVVADNLYATKDELNNRVPIEIKGTYNLNNLLSVGFYTINGNMNVTNAPVTGAYSVIVTRSANGNYFHQMIIQDGTYNIYLRYYNGSTWSSWKKLLYDDEKAYDTTRVDGREVKYYTQSQFASITPNTSTHYVIIED